MAATTKIRLSQDVEQIAQEICRLRGLGGVRQAVEAVMRTCAEHYLAGNCSQSPKINFSKPQPIAPVELDGNAAMAELGF